MASYLHSCYRIGGADGIGREKPPYQVREGQPDLLRARPGWLLGSFKNEMRGCGPFLHDDPGFRPERGRLERPDAPRPAREHPALVLCR
jgi:hypothetical protein